jgi:hypothetical protein
MDKSTKRRAEREQAASHGGDEKFKRVALASRSSTASDVWNDVTR